MPATLSLSLIDLRVPRGEAPALSVTGMDMGGEIRLLLACLRWPITAETRRLVSGLAVGSLDWGLFKALVERHRVYALVERALRESYVSPPPEIADAMRAAAGQASWGELRLAGQLKLLLAALGEAGIKPIVLKGLGLAIRAYGQLGMRYNRDIDLLIAPGEVLAACAVLEQAGFARIEPAANVGEAGLRRWLGRQKDMVYAGGQGGQIVEIHWRLFDNRHLLPVKDAGARGQVAVAPDFLIDTLPPELDLIFICVHGASHAWSRLKWLADLNALLARMTLDELLALHEAARARGVHRATAQAMLLCAELLGLVIPAAVLEDARRDWRIRGMKRVARHSILASGKAEIEDLALGSTLKNISHYLLGKGLPYFLSEAYFDLTDLSHDDNAANLPSVLVPFSRLYFWVLRQRRAARRRAAAD